MTPKNDTAVPAELKGRLHAQRGLESAEKQRLTPPCAWPFPAVPAAQDERPLAWGVPNSRPCESALLMDVLLDITGCQYPELLVPLYATPQASAKPAEVAATDTLTELTELVRVAVVRGYNKHEIDVAVRRALASTPSTAAEKAP